MNDRARALRLVLKKRGMNIAYLAKVIQVSPDHLGAVLAGRREGKYTWNRIRSVTTAEEQHVIVDLYGKVFGEDWVDEMKEEGIIV